LPGYVKNVELITFWSVLAKIKGFAILSFDGWRFAVCTAYGGEPSIANIGTSFSYGAYLVARANREENCRLLEIGMLSN